MPDEIASDTFYSDPMPEVGLCALAIGAAWCVAAYRSAGGFIPALAVSAAALGFVAAQAHTRSVSTVPLACPTGPGWVEGRVVEAEPVEGATLRWLNRLSDLLFVAARAANAHDDIADVPWTPEA